jgi:hypothetical protein
MSETPSQHNSEPKRAWALIHLYLILIAVFFLLAGISWFRHASDPDFACLYAQARLVHETAPSRLYDVELQRGVQQRLFGEKLYGGHVMPFVHPPFVMALLYPLGLLSYDQARVVWAMLNILLVLALPWVFFRMSPEVLGRAKTTVYLAALAFYPFLVCVWQGQVSLVLLFLVALAYLNLRKGKEFQAGLLLGSAFLKFHLVYLLAGWLLFKRRISAILGLACSLGVLVTASVVWLGEAGIGNYLTLLASMSKQNNYTVLQPERMQNWIGQTYLLGFKGIYHSRTAVILGLVAFILTAALWRKRWDPAEPEFGLRFAATLLLCLLASPYLLMHDLSLLFLGLMLCLEFLLQSPQKNWTTLALSSLLLASPIVWFVTLLYTDRFPIQLSVVWMSATLAVLILSLRRAGALENGTSKSFTARLGTSIRLD